VSFIATTKYAASSPQDALEHATNGLFQRLQDAGWTIHNTVVSTPGAKDIIFKSTGEAGTESFFVRITQTSSTTILFRIASYYAASGTPGANDGNEVGVANYTHTQFASAGAANVWIYGDKDCIAVTFEQGAVYSTFLFGTPQRIEQTANSGRTTLTAGVTINGAGNTALAVASSANMTAAQKLFVVNQHVTSKGTIVRCTLVSVDNPTQVTVSNDSGTNTVFEAGALVGMDPLPAFVGICSYSGGTYQGFPSWGFAHLYHPATTRMTGTAQTTPAIRTALSAPASLDFYVNAVAKECATLLDPDANLNRPIMSCLLLGHFNATTSQIAGADQLRGRVRRIGRFPFVAGAVAAEDTFTEGAVTWRIFPDVSPTNIYYGMFAIRTSA